MKIKGHTKIELTNVKTGEVEVYEDDNMLTSGIDYYLTNVAGLSGSPFLTAEVRNNIIPVLLGGLLLLDTELDEHEDNIICPSGVKMVGNGTYEETYDGEDGVTELGSWNFTESGWKTDGTFHAVWDFHDTQANCDTAHGQMIKCCCLTSATHGFIGEGNSQSMASKPWNASNRKSDFSYPGTPISVNIDGFKYPGVDFQYQPDRIVHASRINNTVDMIDLYNLLRHNGHTAEHMSETGKIKLTTHYLPTSQLDVRFGAGQENIPTTETELTLNQSFVAALNHNNPNYWKKFGDTYCIVAGLSAVDYGQGQWGRIPANGTMHITRINADNTVSYFAIPNPNGSTLLDVNVFSIVVSATTLYFMANNGHMYFIDLTTPADVTVVEGGTSIIDYAYPELEVAGGAGSKIDLGERKVYPDNGWRNSSGFHKYETYMDDLPLSNLIVSDLENAKSTGMYMSQNYLATINNLETPIQKTADKTMKVTYTLDFDDEE